MPGQMLLWLQEPMPELEACLPGRHCCLLSAPLLAAAGCGRAPTALSTCPRPSTSASPAARASAGCLDRWHHDCLPVRAVFASLLDSGPGLGSAWRPATCPLLQATPSPPASQACTASPSPEPSSGPRVLQPQPPRLSLQPQLSSWPRLPQLPSWPRLPQLQRQQPQAWRGLPRRWWPPHSSSPFLLLADSHPGVLCPAQPSVVTLPSCHIAKTLPRMFAAQT